MLTRVQPRVLFESCVRSGESTFYWRGAAAKLSETRRNSLPRAPKCTRVELFNKDDVRLLDVNNNKVNSFQETVFYASRQTEQSR